MIGKNISIILVMNSTPSVNFTEKNGMIRRIFIFIVIAWSLQSQGLPAGGLKVYVSSEGNDSGKGSLGSPFPLTGWQ